MTTTTIDSGGFPTGLRADRKTPVWDPADPEAMGLHSRPERGVPPSSGGSSHGTTESVTGARVRGPITQSLYIVPNVDGEPMRGKPPPEYTSAFLAHLQWGLFGMAAVRILFGPF